MLRGAFQRVLSIGGFAAAACLALTCGAARGGEPADAQKLLTIGRGGVPIVLSVPHGGQLPIPGCPERRGEGVPAFVALRDGGTDLLAERLVAEMEKRLGGRPYLVMARFHRKFLDVNRVAAAAYESDLAKPCYDGYHRGLREACDEVRKRWGRGLLVDLHGQGADADGLFRGTGDGRTVAELLKRHGRPALVGPESIFGRLAAQGHKVIPANDSEEREDKRYRGGYIVQTYGSHRADGIDAIQFEFGSACRGRARLDRTASDVAEAIARFAKEYLPADELPKAPNTPAAPAARPRVRAPRRRRAAPAADRCRRQSSVG
jgi:N-formylglutamate amidohydrolase